MWGSFAFVQIKANAFEDAVRVWAFFLKLDGSRLCLLQRQTGLGKSATIVGFVSQDSQGTHTC